MNLGKMTWDEIMLIKLKPDEYLWWKSDDTVEIVKKRKDKMEVNNG